MLLILRIILKETVLIDVSVVHKRNAQTGKVPSVEIPTRCSFVIEFIIPKFIEGSTCFERHTAYHQEL